MKNTTLKGDKFELLCYQVILKSLKAGNLGLLPDCCRVFQKKKYYSALREKDIIFDLSIEVWLPEATQFSYLFIIECKDLSDPVPVDDVEEFDNKVQQVSGLNVKGIFMSRSILQSGAEKYLKNRKIMWIHVNQAGEGNVRLNMARRKSRSLSDQPVTEIQHDIEQIREIQSFVSDNLSAEEIDWEALMYIFLRNIFTSKNILETSDTGVFGLERLSANLIESLTLKIISEFEPGILSHYKQFPLARFQDYLKEIYGLKIIENEYLESINGVERSGYYDPETKTVHIDSRVMGTDRYPYVFCHEVGHFFLHSNLKMSQTLYDESEDSPYNPETGKHDLITEKHWIEWQANKFASNLLMPKRNVLYRLMSYQYQQGIRNIGKIHYDDQPCNIRDFQVYLLIMSDFFSVSYQHIEYRLSDLDILTYARKYSRNYYRPNGFARTARTIKQIYKRINPYLMAIINPAEK